MMGADFAYAPLMHDNNLVAPLNCGETVSDDNGCPAFHQVFNRLADLDFGLRIHARGRLIQNQYLRVVRERTSEGQELALSDGEGRATLVHRVVQTHRQCVQERRQVHILGRLADTLS